MSQTWEKRKLAMSCQKLKYSSVNVVYWELATGQDWNNSHLIKAWPGSKTSQREPTSNPFIPKGNIAIQTNIIRHLKNKSTKLLKILSEGVRTHTLH